MVITQVDLIESVGGGSCRCMLVENWSTITPFIINQQRNLSSFGLKHSFSAKN
jgi:hypothetical protein